MNKTVKIIVYVVGFFILMGVVNWCSSCGSEKKKSRDEIINEAIAANDFHTCDSVLIAVKDGCDGVYRLNEYYWPRAQKIVKAQADYLIETDDPDAEKLFLKILNDNNMVFGEYTYIDNSDDNSNHWYREAVNKYNAFCLVTVNQCLLNDKPELARKVAKFIRQDMTRDNEKIYHLENTSIDAAKKAIAEYDAEH